MARTVGWPRAALTLLALCATVLASRPADAAGARVHTPGPPPGGVVAAGSATLSAWLASDAPVASTEVTVDGTPVLTTQVGPRDAQRGTPLTATAQLTAGRHTVRVTFSDTDGASASRSWEIHAHATAVERLAGDDRFATAVVVSRDAFPADDSAPAAVLARGGDHADALAGAPLAAHLGSPLLLAAAGELPDVTAAELTRVLPQGATVHLLGGTDALSDAVAGQVEALGFTTQRHEGESRFATAAAIAAQLPATDHAFVVSATAFADALAASVPAARDGSPILLTAADDLPAETADALTSLAPATVTIVGGTGVVSDAVRDAVDRLVPDVGRVAGADRFETAAQVLATHFEAPAGVVVANGTTFPDALAGAPRAAALDRPLLLTTALSVPNATVDALRGVRPESVTVLGGPVAVTADVATGVAVAAEEPATAPRVLVAAPAVGSQPRYVGAVSVDADRTLDAAASTLHVEVAGTEVPAELWVDGARAQVTFATDLVVAYDVPHEARVTAALVDADTGEVVRRAWTFTYRVPDPHFGDAGPVPLHLPSRDVELIGFHQSNHDGARDIAPRTTSTAMLTMASRNRGTGLRTAADVVANPDLPVFAPATGTVLRAGSYRLYCDHTDHYLVIEPDARPGWEVKVLHFEGLAVAKGDRVVAGRTRIGSAPRVLPFDSQVDDHSGPDDWPHLHIEVVDPSIPDRPGSGC